MTDQTAAEIINDLIRVYNDRIGRYEDAILKATAVEPELRVLLAKIVGESHHNKIFLATELQAMGEPIDLSLTTHGKVFAEYVHQLPESCSHGREALLNFSDMVEEAVLAACRLAHQSDEVAAYLKDIITQHQGRCNNYRVQIRQLREKTT
jgi:hypothetical protein